MPYSTVSGRRRGRKMPFRPRYGSCYSVGRARTKGADPIEPPDREDRIRGKLGSKPFFRIRRLGKANLLRRKKGSDPNFPLTRLSATPCLALVGGCAEVQSAFAPFGAEADAVRVLAIAMFSAAAAITVGVLALAAHAVRRDEGIGPRGAMRVVLWLGGIGPTVLLAALLAASLPRMQPLAAPAGGLVIAVEGEQFWWRVVYRPDGVPPIETANEIRVPVGRAVTFVLESPDVIHSLWIPGLAGKVDLIPGRTNELVVVATARGRFRGVCAEFCGPSHALMAFDVVALDAEAFDAWLAELARPAADATAHGRTLFDEYGCPGCHVVRGHFAGTPIGPDLTHYGARANVAAGTLPMSVAATSRFIRDPRELKPGARMPAFRDMPRDDADAIAEYLVELD